MTITLGVLNGLVGGVLIGAGSVVLLLGSGKILGVSGKFISHVLYQTIITC